MMKRVAFLVFLLCFLLNFGGLSYPASVDDLISSANEKRREKDFEEALKLYSDALPKSGELSFYLKFYIGLIYLEKKDYSQAIAYFDDLWKLRDKLPLELFTLLPYRMAQVYEEMGDLGRAYDFYLIALAYGRDSFKTLAYKRLASLSYSMGKYEKSFDWLLPVLQDNPNDGWANEMVLKLYRKIDNPSEELLYRVGRAYYLRNDYESALGFFKRSNRKFWEGLTLERLNRKKEAFDTYKTLVKAGTVSETLLKRFINLAEALDAKREAIFLLSALLNKDPKNEPLILYCLYSLSGDAKFKRSLKERYPTSDWALEVAWFDGWRKYISGKYKDAMKEWGLITKYHKGSLAHAKVVHYLSKVGLYRKDEAKRELLSFFPTEYYTVKRYGIPLNNRVPTFPEDRLLRRLYKVGFWEVAFIRANLLEKLDPPSRNYYLSLVTEKLSNYSSSIAYAYLLINSGFRDRVIWRRAYPLGDHYDYILKVAKAEEVDPLLVLAVIHQESRFDPQVVSWAGAIGLMQLMPFTGRAYGVKDRELLFSPDVNLRLGIKHLKEFLDRYKGNLYLALAAYNAGPGNVDRWLKEIKARDWEEWAESIPFRETRNYVRKVMSAYRIYKELYRKDNRLKS